MSSDKKPRPSDVGQSFVKTYSRALETDPSLLSNFFRDDSLYTHKEAHEASETVDRGREVTFLAHFVICFVCFCQRN